MGKQKSHQKNFPKRKKKEILIFNDFALQPPYLDVHRKILNRRDQFPVHPIKGNQIPYFYLSTKSKKPKK